MDDHTRKFFGTHTWAIRRKWRKPSIQAGGRQVRYLNYSLPPGLPGTDSAAKLNFGKVEEKTVPTCGS
jgi:hypothetical protein